MEKPEIPPSPSENAWTDGICTVDHVPDTYHDAKFHYDTIK